MNVEVVCDKSLDHQIKCLQLQADMWVDWATERGCENPDKDGWLTQQIDRIRGGNYVILPAYVDGEIAGMVDIQVDYEPSERCLIAFVDKLYVRPPYRNGRVAFQLVQGADFVGHLMGVKYAKISVAPTGPIKFYKRYGFDEDMTVLSYEVY